MVAEVSAAIADPELAWLFANCFPNTLDTTVGHEISAAGKPDTFVITGDIDAMWLRDSTNQVWPYLSLVNEDPKLKAMFQGLIHRQARSVLRDPYANAFLRIDEGKTHWSSDHTEMRPMVFERKYELDSLCAAVRLACGYYFRSRDASCFDADWLASVELILKTIRHEQADSEEQGETPVYRFERTTRYASDSLTNKGKGNPFRRTGMSRNAFRPSDDACVFQFLVPANAMAVVCLGQLAEVLSECGLAPTAAKEAKTLAEQIEAGIRRHAVVQHNDFGAIFAYEVDGFGGSVLMDDANCPSLLSLPYLGYGLSSDPIYQATRRFVLSPANPFFSKGTAGHGICSPHVGANWIWPISLTMQAMTSSSESEILQCLSALKRCHGGTGFMHEAFWKDDATRFTRPWFAWANSLFGEMLLGVYRSDARLLKANL